MLYVLTIFDTVFVTKSFTLFLSCYIAMLYGRDTTPTTHPTMHLRPPTAFLVRINTVLYVYIHRYLNIVNNGFEEKNILNAYNFFLK